MKQSLFDANINQFHDFDYSLRKFSEFLAQNRSSIYIDQNRREYLLNSIIMISKSPLSLFYHKIYDMTKLNMFGLLDLSKTSNFPEILLLKYMSIDTLFLKEYNQPIYNVIKTFPEFSDKIITNITTLLNKDRNKIIDITSFQKIVVRDLCSRSYGTYQNRWLSGKLLEYLTDFYSMAISNNLARVYNFSFQEQINIAIILAYYFVTKCIDNFDEKINFISNLKFLGSKNTIDSIVKSIVEFIKEKNYNELDNQQKLIETIKVLSPQRIVNLDLKIFNTLCRTFNSDQIVSLISIDYPGYWLYNIFTTTSIEKNNLYFIFKRINYLKKANQFMIELLNSPIFIESVSK